MTTSCSRTRTNVHKMSSLYALYKGDSILAVGTMKEIAEAQHLKMTTLLYLKSPSYQKKLAARKPYKSGRLELFYIGEEEADRAAG